MTEGAVVLRNSVTRELCNLGGEFFPSGVRFQNLDGGVLWARPKTLEPEAEKILSAALAPLAIAKELQFLSGNGAALVLVVTPGFKINFLGIPPACPSDVVAKTLRSVLTQSMPEGDYHVVLGDVISFQAAWRVSEDGASITHNISVGPAVFFLLVRRSQALRVEEALRDDKGCDGVHAWSTMSEFTDLMNTGEPTMLSPTSKQLSELPPSWKEVIRNLSHEPGGELEVVDEWPED